MKARRRSRLPVGTQKRLLEHFVAGTPARSAAEPVSVNRNTATLYYRKLREIIAEQIAHDAPFPVRSKSMKAVSVDIAKVNGAEALPEKLLFLVC